MLCDIASSIAEQSVLICSLTIGVGGLWALTPSLIPDIPFLGECCSEVENKVEFKALVDLDCFSADFKILLCCCVFLYFLNFYCNWLREDCGGKMVACQEKDGMPETALRGTQCRNGFIPYLCYVRSYVRGHHQCCLSFLQHALFHL